MVVEYCGNNYLFSVNYVVVEGVREGVILL